MRLQRSMLFVPASPPAMIGKAAASAADAVCIDLEDSIAIDEKGQALKEHCEKQLKDAEARIEKITLKPDGKPGGTAPLDVE